jgi:hypothetical protein
MFQRTFLPFLFEFPEFGKIWENEPYMNHDYCKCLKIKKYYLMYRKKQTQ